MKIRKPLTNVVSQKVNKWSEIETQALELREMLQKKGFEGYFEDAFAIQHTQVSENPFDFFVIRDDMANQFGSWCIINLKIIEKTQKVSFPEGCMSFPFRQIKKVPRYKNITVKYQVPWILGMLRKKTKKFSDLNAFICQHEFDHARGMNIYDY